MSVADIVIMAAGTALAGLAAGYWLPPHGRMPGRNRPRPVRRILLPFTGQAISRRSFEAAVRLAKAENAIIMPAYLAQVPMNLPLESALPVQCASGMPLLEAIAHRPRAIGPRRTAPATRSGALRSNHRVGRRRPAIRARVRRSQVVARACAGRDSHTSPGARGHAENLSQRRPWPVAGPTLTKSSWPAVHSSHVRNCSATVSARCSTSMPSEP
jgi:hypothetical protein